MEGVNVSEVDERKKVGKIGSNLREQVSTTFRSEFYPFEIAESRVSRVESSLA